MLWWASGSPSQGTTVGSVTSRSPAAIMSFSCGVLVQTLGWQAINGAMLLVLALLVWQLLRATTGQPEAAKVPN